MKYHPDGTPISASSINLKTAGKSKLSEEDILKVLNVSSRANEISIASIREVFFTDNILNQSKNRVEYRVRIEFGPRHGQEYDSVMAINLYGGVANFSETVYYPKTKLIKGKKENDEDRYIFDHDASQVLIAFMNGYPNQPFIISSWHNTNHPIEFATKESDGQRHVEEYNGMRLEKNKDGEWVLTYYGGQRDTQTKETERPETAPTFIKFDKTGSLIFEDKENQQIKIDRVNKKITITQFANTKSDETYGETDSSDPGDVVNQMIMDKVAKTIITKAGNNKVIHKIDGTAENIVMTFESGLVVTIDGAGDKVSVVTAAGAKIDIDGASDKVIVKGATIELGEGATEKAILGDLFKVFFDAHIHPTGVGPSGPPTVPQPPTTLSDRVKVKK